MADEEDIDDQDEVIEEALGRSRDLLDRRTAIRDHLEKLFNKISKGFQDQADRSDDLDKWWNIWFCKLDDNQYYNGNAQVYVPIIRDAIEARGTRFSNQMFPSSGQYIDCTTESGSEPYEVLAILNNYYDLANIQTDIVEPLIRNSDIEGQMNLYVDWYEIERQIVSRETRHAEVPTAGGPTPAEGAEVEDIVEEDVTEGRPGFEVLHDSDVLIIPANAENIEDALERGGAAVIVRRWTEDDIDRMADAGEIREDAADELKKQGMFADETMSGVKDTTKKLIKSVGIKSSGKHTIVFECWTKLPLKQDDEGEYAYSKKGKSRICRVWFGINRQQLGAKRNPYWCDRVPLFSKPQQKISGLAKGKSRVEPLAPVQYEANDAANERADSDHYAAMPIVRDGAEDNNRPLILNLGAVWQRKHGEIEFMAFPDLSTRARMRVEDAMKVIFQSLGVNAAMLPQMTGGQNKKNQAEIANEQAVDLLSTARAVGPLGDLLTEVTAFIVDLDHQFRDKTVQVRAYGEMGIEAQMIAVPPLQNRRGYYFKWNGAEQARFNAAMQQQGVAFINVARGMAQQLQAEGYELRLGPLLEKSALNLFGAKQARLVLVDKRRQMSMDPELENLVLEGGGMVAVHKLDVDEKHIPVHMQMIQQTGDPHGVGKMHLDMHIQQMNAKRMAMMQQLVGGMMTGQPQGGGAQGVPGGAGPGVAGTPRQGAVPGVPRVQGPPGMIHQDRLPRAGGGGVVPMPRKM